MSSGQLGVLWIGVSAFFWGTVVCVFETDRINSFIDLLGFFTVGYLVGAIIVGLIPVLLVCAYKDFSNES